MKAVLLAENRFGDDVAAHALRHSLQSAGNDVDVVAAASDASNAATLQGVMWIDGMSGERRGVVTRLKERVESAASRNQRRLRALADRVASVGPSIVYPTTAKGQHAAEEAARSAEGVVVRRPAWPDAGDVDAIRRTPADPRWGTSPAGAGLPLHTGRALEIPPVLGDMSITLCFRDHGASPGRFLASALRRAGIRVSVADSVDWSGSAGQANAVVIVESPYPQLQVTGTRKSGVPVLFWVHHGEHHLAANLRLVDRYGADAVLLAHSWHLGHRFPVPVHRFPFAVDPELVRNRPHSERRFDVAMVGAHIGGGGGYEQRGRLVASIESSATGQHAFREGVSVEEMADLYAQARIVLNDGGSRHYPITMRVFEAVGAGAALATMWSPGLETLFDPAEHFEEMTEASAADQVRRMLDDRRGTEKMAGEAQRQAIAHHTYDHRVVELNAVIAATSPRGRSVARQLGPLAAAIDDDVEVQRIVEVGAPIMAEELPDREVWEAASVTHRLAPGAFDAVAVAGENPSPELLGAARRYIYSEGVDVSTAVRRVAPDATHSERGSVVRWDLHAPAYRVDRLAGVPDAD